MIERKDIKDIDIEKLQEVLKSLVEEIIRNYNEINLIKQRLDMLEKKND